jgi:hypothetical protein
MTIELTEEIELAYGGAYSRARQASVGVFEARRAGLRAVLAIVARDTLSPIAIARVAYEHGQRDERALTQLLGRVVEAAPAGCGAGHGAHPHDGMTCLDCSVCRPPRADREDAADEVAERSWGE